MPALTQTDLSEEEINRVKSVIKEFLVQSKHKELFETRIQKLVFYSEVYCVLYYRRRLTHAEYRPYMYGAFSRDVRIALNSLEGVDKNKKIIHGDRTTGYSLEENSDSLNNDAKDIIGKVCEHVKHESTEELAQFSKDSWLFEETDYNHPMIFPEFAEALDENPKIERSLKKQMASKVDDVDEEESLVPLERE